MRRSTVWAVAACVVLSAALWWCLRPVPIPPDAQVDQVLVDSLRRENARLEVERQRLAAEYAVAEVAKVQAMRERAAAVADARRSAARLDSALRHLPRTVPPTLSDSATRALYAMARVQLDSAVALVWRQAARIQQDSSLLAAGVMRERNLTAQLTIAVAQQQVLATERTEWETKYTRLLEVKTPRCQWKCGVAIGVVGTVAAAWGVRQVIRTGTTP